MNKTALTLLNSIEQTWLIENIREAELCTTGEIRVHLEDYTLKSTLDRSSEVFAELNMHNTSHRNGVLLYIAVTQSQMAIIGDMAINHKVADSYWNEQISVLKAEFRKENYYEGIMKVVNNIGAILKEEFPIGSNPNPNELPDEISFA